MKRFILLFIVQTLTVAAIAAEIRGEIVKLEDEEEVYVKDETGKKKEFKVDESTKYLKSGQRIQFSDLKIGMIVELNSEGKHIIQLEVK